MGPITAVLEKRELFEDDEPTTDQWGKEWGGGTFSLTLIAWTEKWALFVRDNYYPCWGNVLSLDWFSVERKLEENTWRFR